jgi:hypothetical protein
MTANTVSQRIDNETILVEIILKEEAMEVTLVASYLPT